ncbi:MAG: acetyl-CoA C-acyltransferase [Verrucomicrobiales bacterium]|nr:acetyl-CoA C-acyltransferase [Verrucomicrobiales bacterium]|tara:strand:+ start:862 stop:1998 length:1137 start_codon:yes stop_codon:yes gene_type:complete
MSEVCIVAARRTPFGRFLGSLSRLSGVELACHAGQAAIGDFDRTQIDQVIVGNILSAGQGMNVARQVGVRLGLPIETPAFTVNMMCASGMQAIALGAQAIRAGDANAVLCGGTESMSNAPHLLPRSRTGIKLGDGRLVDSMLRDGLVDAFDHQHMANTAQALADKYGIEREEQDEFAASSQKRFAKSQSTGAFDDELVSHERLAQDEHPRPDTSAASLGELNPAFDKTGSITAGNASGVNDGAAMLLLTERQTAESNGWPIMAIIDATASVGCDPKLMGLGPVQAIRKLSVELSEFDAIEINEAFAAQVLACCKELDVDPHSINPNGGAIAVGHPIGASGARLVGQLAWRIRRGEIKKGLASLCVGGGMGTVVSLRMA